MRKKTIARLAVVTGMIATAGVAMAQQSPSEEQVREIRETAKPLAEQGNANAQYNMGVLYDEGYGVKQDYDTARYWYEKAAAQNYAKAEHNLGIMYQEGNGVKADPAAAARWFKRAAEHGEPAAQNNLAVMYVRGQGTDQNLGLAALWAARAARAGNRSAINNLPYIAADLPQSHIDGDNVNIRTEPDKDGKVLRQADRGTQVVVIDGRDKWSRVLFTDDYAVGWVADFLLTKPEMSQQQTIASASTAQTTQPEQPAPKSEAEKPQEPPQAAQPEPPAQPAAPEPPSKPTPPAEPSQPSVAKAEPKPAEKPTEQEQKPQAEPAAVAEKEKEKAQPKPEEKQRHIAGDVVNIRRRATTHSDVIFQAHQGDTVTIIESKNDWRYVRFENGSTGWVAGFLLTD